MSKLRHPLGTGAVISSRSRVGSRMKKLLILAVLVALVWSPPGA